MKTAGMQHWQCVNRDCAAAETRDLPRLAAAPRCACGSPMERVEVSATFSYLDFLQDEEHQAEEYLTEKE
jgi:hypothetical protein